MSRIRSGIPEWHTYSTGDPWICWVLPLPRALVRGLIEPVACGWFGYQLAHNGDPATLFIGWWITIAAFLMFAQESSIRTARRDRLLDLGDTFVESEDFARRAEKFTSAAQGDGTAAQKQRRLTSLWGAIFWGMRSAQQNAQHAWRARHHAKEHARERQRQQQQQRDEQKRFSDAASGKMTVEQALEILELKAGATEAEIKEAYNRLIQRVHPDVGGSTYFAKQLNAARDVLLKPKKR